MTLSKADRHAARPAIQFRHGQREIFVAQSERSARTEKAKSYDLSFGVMEHTGTIGDAVAVNRTIRITEGGLPMKLFECQ